MSKYHELPYIIVIIFVLIALSNFGPSEQCALPYWWVQRYSLQSNNLQGVQPKTTYRYREYLQVFDPNSFVHAKEYSEYTWWESDRTNLPGSKPGNGELKDPIPNNSEIKVRSGSTKGGSFKPKKTLVPDTPNVKKTTSSDTTSVKRTTVLDTTSARETTISDTTTAKKTTRFDTTSVKEITVTDPTTAEKTTIPTTTSSTERFSNDDDFFTNTVTEGNSIEEPIVPINSEAERNENESEEIEVDDLSRNNLDRKLDLLREDTSKNSSTKDEGTKKSGSLLLDWFGWGSHDNETQAPQPCRPIDADIHSLRSMIEKMFNFPREHTVHEENKEKAREDILNKFKEIGLQVWTQNFTIPEAPNSAGQEEESKEGVNLIGVIPGLHRGQYEDGIVLVGAHYDTVPDSNGVDDNGSGLAVMLEVAKMLMQPRCRFNNTLMFVAFDLQENGAIGSNYFVDNYLIPEELKRARAHFQGAFILDGIMNFNSNTNSQELPVDYAQSLPGLQNFVNNSGNRGDFLAMISRNYVDNNLSTMLMEAWQKLGDNNYKLYNLAINMGNKIPPPSMIESHLNFLNSDHATFWYHNSTTSFPETLNAVLLTDTGPFRGQMKKCYHSECDDLTAMSPEKLQFAKKTANALSATLVEMTEATAKGNGLKLNIVLVLVCTLFAHFMKNRI